MQAILEKAAKIKLLVCDVDGVLTDGRIYAGIEGSEIRVFHIHDGLGIKMLLAQGIEVGVISGRTCPIVKARMQQLGVTHIYQGHENKIPIFEEIREKLQLLPEEIAYVGDDLLDIPLLRRVGLGITVANGNHIVKQHAHWQTENSGGHGAVREVCELILKAQDKLNHIIAGFLI